MKFIFKSLVLAVSLSAVAYASIEAMAPLDFNRSINLGAVWDAEHQMHILEEGSKPPSKGNGWEQHSTLTTSLFTYYSTSQVSFQTYASEGKGVPTLWVQKRYFNRFGTLMTQGKSRKIEVTADPMQYTIDLALDHKDESRVFYVELWFMKFEDSKNKIGKYQPKPIYIKNVELIRAD